MGSKLEQLYTGTGQLLLGVGLFFTLLNLLALPFIPAPVDPPTARYGRALMLEQYPGEDRAELEQMLRETWSRPHVYAPFVQYAEPPFEGRYVNVSEHGFRHSVDQGPWPPDPENVNVFLFGGSTLFGYGVRDDETIASYLQLALARRGVGRPVKAYNFARASYYSSLERTLFAELLAAGHVPDIAVFVDGLNDFHFEEPPYSELLRRAFEPSAVRALISLARQLPVLQLVSRLKGAAEPEGVPVIDPAYDDPALLDARIDRYLGNVAVAEALAVGHGVRPVFVVQPVPTHGLDLARHPFGGWSFRRHAYSAFGYPRLAARLARDPERPHVVWAADLQAETEGPLYVDQIHYTKGLARAIAEHVAAHLARAAEPVSTAEGTGR